MDPATIMKRWFQIAIWIQERRIKKTHEIARNAQGRSSSLRKHPTSTLVLLFVYKV